MQRVSRVLLLTAQSARCPRHPTQVSYRYNVVKARMQLLQSRLADINAIVSGRSAGCCRHNPSVCRPG